MINFRNLLIFSVLSLCFVPTVHADVRLSVTSFEGGNSLRFGRVDQQTAVEREVRLRITSTGGQQYQVFQRVVEPFVNQGGSRARTEAVKTYARSGSNASGTLYLQQEDSLRYAEQLVYTSAPDGVSDSIRLVYAVDQSIVDEPGNYFGQILYTVRSFGSASQDQVFLNAYFESARTFSINIHSQQGGTQLRLNDQDELHRKDGVEIEFSGKGGDIIDIYQEVEIYPKDATFQEIDPKLIVFSTSGNSSAALDYQTAQPLSRQRIQLYSSQLQNDRFFVSFAMNPNFIAQHTAGTFQGRINYIVETKNGSTKYPIDINIMVNPVFQLNVELPPEGIQFDNIIPNAPPQFAEVKVEVRTNLQRPYMVNHQALASLTNEKGDEIKAENFQLKVEMAGASAGESRFSNFSAVQKGDVPIFFSNKRGDSVQFKAIYRLSPFTGMKPGQYSTSIMYSLGER